MRNKWLGRLAAATVGAGLGLLALYPQTAMEAVRGACGLWAGSVMPALFPYLVLSQLLVANTGSTALVAPLAMLGGSPAGARLVALAGYPPEKAQRMAALCTTASPLYILGALSGGWRMLLAHWLGAGAAWGFVRLAQSAAKGFRSDPSGGRAGAPAGGPPAPGGEKKALGLGESIRDAALAMVAVCGCMCLFGALGALLDRLLSLPPALSCLAACVLEMAGGCGKIGALGLSPGLTAALLCGAASFEGLSIFVQNAAYLKPAGVNLRVQLCGRLIHAAAAFFLCLVLYRS